MHSHSCGNISGDKILDSCENYYIISNEAGLAKHIEVMTFG